MFLCFSSSRRTCCRLQALHALSSNRGELLLSVAVNECRAFIFAPKNLVTQFLLRFPERHWCALLYWMVHLLFTTQIPVILSVLSNSYDDKEPIIRHASKWLWWIPTLCACHRDLSWEALAALLFHWSQGMMSSTSWWNLVAEELQDILLRSFPSLYLCIRAGIPMDTVTQKPSWEKHKLSLQFPWHNPK